MEVRCKRSDQGIRRLIDPLSAASDGALGRTVQGAVQVFFLPMSASETVRVVASPPLQLA